MSYFIQTFGCQANKADSERMAGVLEAMGIEESTTIVNADIIILNTCSIRQSAENRVYSRMESLRELKKVKPHLKVVVAGCMIGPHGDTPRDSKISERLEGADKLVGTQDYSRLWEIFRDLKPTVGEYLSSKIPYKKMEKTEGYVLISSGCNNFCTFCIVPYARGKEISRPFDEILNEVNELALKGYKRITLIGQNVNSYGADLVLGKPLGGDRLQINELKRRKKLGLPLVKEAEDTVAGPYEDMNAIQNASDKVGVITLPTGREVKPVYVKHLGKARVPTLFPHLLDAVSNIPGIEEVSFMSSNPWDFSDELIETIARNKKIDRQIHLPVQSGDNEILQRMNRWYSREDYISLTNKIRQLIPEVTFTTDIIVGFPGETEAQFNNTVDLCKQVGFKIAFIAEYSIRPGTAASMMKDDIKNWDKKRRFQILDELVNGVKHSEHAPVKIGNVGKPLLPTW
ncbi:MAG: MiaB/RimO family radical SAM methylthiotransferase [bacterium]|nr:MiaB/RimO family radical SAM methylthiotransferase [bacterium]